MLLRHSATYLLGRGLPGLLNFAALACYTRLLAPDELGYYAIIVAGVGLAEALLFSWLRLVLGRFLQAHKEAPARFLGGVAAVFILLAIAASSLALLAAAMSGDTVVRRMLALAVPLLIAQAWFQFTLVLASASLEPVRYGKLLVSKTVLAFALGVWLAWIGLGAVAPIAGLVFGQVASLTLFGLASWRGARPRWPAADELRAQLRYGLPLMVTFALTWVVVSSDRIMIGWLIGVDAAGVYSVAYDLAQQGLGLLLAIVNTAAFPLAVNAMERHGRDAARAQVASNGALIVGIALTAAAGLVVLSPQVIDVLIGEQYREGARLVLPWVAVAAAVSGIQSFHFDMAFHLGAQSRWLVVTSGIAALVNLGLNLLLIPSHGILGAAWATLAAYLLATLCSAWLGSRVFPMPAFAPMLLSAVPIAVATALAAWWAARAVDGLVGLLTGLAAGASAAGILAFAVDLAGLRQAVVHRIVARRSRDARG